MKYTILKINFDFNYRVVGISQSGTLGCIIFISFINERILFSF